MTKFARISYTFKQVEPQDGTLVRARMTEELVLLFIPRAKNNLEAFCLIQIVRSIKDSVKDIKDKPVDNALALAHKVFFIDFGDISLLRFFFFLFPLSTSSLQVGVWEF